MYGGSLLRRGVPEASLAQPQKRFLPVALRPTAQAMEIGLLGTKSRTGDATVQCLSECFKMPADEDGAKERLHLFLASGSYPACVRVADDQYVAFYPQVCTDVFPTRELAAQSLKPFLEASAANKPCPPRTSATELRGKMNVEEIPLFLSQAEWSLIALALAAMEKSYETAPRACFRATLRDRQSCPARRSIRG